MLIYQRIKTKESDIPHQTLATDCILDWARGIEADLTKELAVNT